MLHKDEALDRLAEIGNVAQFVAFRPSGSGMVQTKARVRGFEPNAGFANEGDAALTLLERSAGGAVNVRSYLPEDPRSREFVYGLRNADEAAAHLRRLTAEGLHVILNETVDVNDGGVSGVAQGAAIEFAPDDTPRAVEKPGIAALPRAMGVELLRAVYGFLPELPSGGDRVEFSIHPSPQGWRMTNTLLWEREPDAGLTRAPRLIWPNRFSRHIGDKVYGLLIGHLLGAPVPSTTAICRRVAPFSFGRPTGRADPWIRTCPREPRPGLYTTVRGWLDPFDLLAREDPDHDIASVLSQVGVPSAFAGATISDDRGEPVIEGILGFGDSFMLGVSPPRDLPEQVRADVDALHRRLSSVLGPVGIEWVHDGAKAWLVQLHVGATESSGSVIVAGEADEWIAVDAKAGLAEIRRAAAEAPGGAGIEIVGDVGLTSHIADVLRKRGLPARIVAADRGGA